MSKEIINRVAKSNLITINLEDYYVQGHRTNLDIKDWLDQELVLKEKEFREKLKSFDWSQYKNHFVALQCSSNAIIPAWAYLLIQTYLHGIAKKVVVGSIETLESIIYDYTIENLNLDHCKNKPVIVKGCSDKIVPQNAYVKLVNKLQPIAKSIMYGEACSSVPLYKKRKEL